MADMTRRQWIRTSTGAAAGLLGSQVLAQGVAPDVVHAGVLGRNAPSNRVTIGMIGVGRQGIHVNLAALLKMPEVRVVALCDVDG